MGLDEYCTTCRKTRRDGKCKMCRNHQAASRHREQQKRSSSAARPNRYHSDNPNRGYANPRPGGGTANSTAFKSKERPDGSVNHLFNSPGDGGRHGDVAEIRHPDGSVTYPFVRDVEGDKYV